MKCFIFILISILMVQNIIESAKVITQQDTVDCIAVNKSCSANKNGCCTFLSCEKDVCKDTASYVMGTETIGGSGIENRVEDEPKINTTETPKPPKPCSKIGEPCAEQRDCCQGYLCHTFLHKCVT